MGSLLGGTTADRSISGSTRVAAHQQINPLSFARYEDYLDAHLTSVDMSYVDGIDLARRLVELRVKGGSEILTREEFESRHAQDEKMRREKRSAPPTRILSQGKDLSKSPFLMAIADREELVRLGKLSTILYIRDFNSKGQEVSGYIDLGARMAVENFEEYFDGKKRLLPQSDDLSYLNWSSNVVSWNDSANFQVIHTEISAHGVLFKHKRDRKIIDVDPNRATGDNSRRMVLETPEYLQIIFFDHVTRRRV